MGQHGVAGSGVAQILADSGVTRRSIYLNFPGGKAELIAAATRSAGDQMAEILRDLVQQPEPIAAFAGMWSEMLVRTDFEGGCPIVAAACGRQEAPEAAGIAAEVFTQLSELMAARLQADGVKPKVAASLALTIVAACEGAVILSRAVRSTTPLEQVSRHLTELIDLHRPA